MKNRFSPTSNLARTAVLRVEPLECRRMLAGIDCDDHGNDAESATVLPTPTVEAPAITSGSLQTVGDVDFFSYTARAGKLYDITIQTDNRSGVEGQLEIDSAFSYLENAAFRRYRAGTVSGVDEDVTIHFSGRFDGDPIVRYDIRIAEVEYADDHGNDVAMATPVAVPSTTAGTFEIPWDSDMFSFEAAAGDLYLFDLLSYNQRLILLFDADGNELVADSGDYAQQAWTAKTSGTYFAKVIGLNDEADSDYSFNVQVIDDDHSALPDSATPIDIPSAIPSRLNYRTDVDVFSFEAISGHRYHISTSGDSNVCGSQAIITDVYFIGGTPHCSLSVLDSSQRPVTFADNNVLPIGIDSLVVMPSFSWVAPDDGTYFVVVSSSLLAPGDYTLEVASEGDDHANVWSDATPIDVPTTSATRSIAGRIDYSGDVDWFSFEAFADVEYAITTGAVAQLFRELDGGQVQLIRQFDAQISFTPLNSETYYIMVSASSGRHKLYGIGIFADLPCDYLGTPSLNGCDLTDLERLYRGEQDVPGPLSEQLIVDWLEQASHPANPAKLDPAHEYVQGDLNLDGQIDSTDLGLLLNNFGSNDESGWSSGDINGDDLVNRDDLGLLLNNFGHRSGQQVAANVVSASLEDLWADDEEEEARLKKHRPKRQSIPQSSRRK